MSEYIVKCNEFVGISGATFQFPEYIDINQEIVRCCDCRFFDSISGLGCVQFDCLVNDENGFCKWAERRDA